MKRLIGIAVVALSCWCQSAGAALVTMDLKFSGIDWEDDGTPADATIRLAFDSIADPDSNPNIGTYTATATLLSGGSSRQAQSPVTVSVTNDVLGVDMFQMSSAAFQIPFVDVDGQPISAASFSLSSSTGQLFASDALPLDPNFASQADLVSLVLTHGDATQGFSPPAPVVEIFTPVPEASTYTLLFAGLAAVFALRRARRS